jgi:hypothetical protein
VSGFRVVALDPATADTVRSTLRTPEWGYPATAEIAAGYGPCRVCLRMFAIGSERRILFTHDPFAGLEPYPLPGPVYIHEASCEAYADPAAFPDALRPLSLTLNAYARGRRLCAQAYVSDGDVEGAAARLLADPDVAYIHARNTDVGCFLVQLDRADQEDFR